MTGSEMLNIRDSVERMMYLGTQVRICDEFAPIEYCTGTIDNTIHLYKNESFEKVREAYSVPADKVEYEYSDENTVLRKSFAINSRYKALVILDSRDEGFEPKEDTDGNSNS